MLVNITEHFIESGREWQVGQNPDVPREVAARWIADGKATADTDGVRNQFPVSGGGVPGFVVTPTSRDSDGIDVALAMCVAAGGGTIMYEDAEYSITRSHTLASGVSHRGVPHLPNYGAYDVPDMWVAGTGGTIFNVAAGVDSFVWNSTDLGATQSPLMAYALSQVNFYGLCFVGGRRAIKIGAANAAGAQDGSIDMVHAYNQTCDDINAYAIDLVNTQFFRVGRLRVSNDQAGAIGGNFRLKCALPGAVLLPGDLHIEEIFSRCTARTRKGVVLEAGGATAAILNDVKVIGRIHASRYTSATPDSVSMVTTSGSADISVPNAAQFAVCTVGMPVRWSSTAPTGFDAVETCFVISRDTGAQTVRLATSDYGSAVTPTSSSTYGTYVAGYPTFMARADAGCAVKNSDFGALACEVTGNIGAVMFSKSMNCIANLNNPSTSYTGTNVILRGAEMGITYGGANNVGVDESSQMAGYCSFQNLAGGAYHHTSGSITLDSSWNGRKVRYSGTSDITVTVPRKLPPGFSVEFVTTGATGIITFAGASGLGMWSKNGLRTNGQYAAVRLRQISTIGYHLTGDTQV